MAGVKDELKGLLRAKQAGYDYLSHFHSHGQAVLSLQVAVNKRQAIRAECGATMGRYHGGHKTIDAFTSINYVF